MGLAALSVMVTVASAVSASAVSGVPLMVPLSALIDSPEGSPLAA